MTTRVHITVDTEFSIGGAFADPQGRRPIGPPSVYCERHGRSEGLGYLLETLEQYGIRGTFFVETLNTCYFGDELMGGIAREIAARGHDVQLHLHPCWTYFEQPNWSQQLQTNPPNDDITRRSEDEQVRLIRMGQDTFTRWGLPAPTVLRTGGLKVGLGVYAAMRRCGMGIASNIGLAIYRPREPELHLFAGHHDIDGIREFPVTTYTDFCLRGERHYKTLTITGCSWPETRTVLKKAREQGVSDVVVLTHPFEFVKHRGDAARSPTLDRINRHRLKRLCKFVAEQPDLEAACMSTLGNEPAAPHDDTLDVPAYRALGRILVNRLNHASVGV
ncbi:MULTISPECIES: polysaccharide deacetylase family protein [unclassified Thioalkalivibrio]|uniref:polysaccharide deacetylase family protein n=1 Tax=unclassified Thioalkalivibrio TaxID=2621013 RepID=UPI00036429B7|nr:MULTISPECIES: polysaccharide deacetylase family protein [unclassified Thioalkalivibrio]